jgi:hypothetical protein
VDRVRRALTAVRRVLFVAATGAAVIVVAPRVGRAQSCHSSALDLGGRETGVSVGATAATFTTPSFEGDYEGLELGGRFGLRALSVDAHVVRYRILRNGLESRGWGDTSLQAAYRWVLSDELGVEGDAFAAAMFPTGDSRHDLGMGHVMFMPGISIVLNREWLLSELVLSYHQAMGEAGGHHHHGGLSPIVDPMNRSEVAWVWSSAAEVVRPIWLEIGVDGAKAADQVAYRAAAFSGIRVPLRRARIGVAAHVPLHGEPFHFKLETLALFLL